MQFAYLPKPIAFCKPFFPFSPLLSDVPLQPASVLLRASQAAPSRGVDAVVDSDAGERTVSSGRVQKPRRKFRTRLPRWRFISCTTGGSLAATFLRAPQRAR